ncbi:hypothetical protein Rhe02_07730 [Rhizocola hellebori]|uniref:Peptidase S1 domain-containing protein n=1 Tax=Rhizocola hellebori TaxID=1392758 RepID=A0A8J3Q3H3_9ACTN|nr:S1 family peptidase [Rhizocola hellebori]GIH02706.1 hypothetical protein Rhe02_07730 [Rhizocola hellebori]
MRRMWSRVLVVLAVLGGIVAAPAVPVMAATPQERGALRDSLAALAPVGSSAVIDPATGEVVVRVAGAASLQFRATAARHRPVRTVNAEQPVRTNAILIGGQAMNSLDGRICSTGLITKHGSIFYVVTAGHCVAGALSPWFGPGGGMIGPEKSAHFPDNDFGLLRVSDVTPYQLRSQVAWETGSVLIGAVADVAVGAPVCKTGRTTGTTCGTVLAKDATWHYPDGVVYGLIETDVCAGPGDSGAPLVSLGGGYTSRSRHGAFGILSGSNNNTCGAPGYRSAFQPLPEVMSFHSLVLPI